MKPSNGSPMLPNLLIAGVPKAGTTSLFRVLASHTEVHGSEIKETHYFGPLLDGGPLAPSSTYEEFFAGSTTERYRLEATPDYIYGGLPLIRHVRDLLPDVKVILILREPASRAVSFYRFKKAHLHLPPDLSFDDYVDACQRVRREPGHYRERSAYMGIEGSHYDHYLTCWLDELGDAVRVVFFDDLVEDFSGLVGQLADWLDLDPAGFAEAGARHDNASTGFRSGLLQRVALAGAARTEGLAARHPELYRILRESYYRVNGVPREEPISQAMQAWLDEHFVPHNQATASLLQDHDVDRLPRWLAATAPPEELMT